MLERVFVWNVSQAAAVTAVILAVFVARFFLRRAPRAYSYLLWIPVAFRLLCPWTVGIPQLLPGTGQASARIWEAVRILETERENGGTIIEENGSSAKKTGDPQKDGMEKLLQEGIKLGSVIWAVGFGTMTLYLVFGNLRMRRKTGTAVRLVEGVYECDGISEPFAAGIFRPRIYLPFELSDKERENVLAHERVHVRRGDCLIRPAAFLLLSVFWYHPLIWAAWLAMCRDMELSCDEAAASAMDPEQREAYARTLVDFACGRKRPKPFETSFGEGEIRMRVLHVMEYRKPGKKTKMLGAALLLGVSMVCLAGGAAAGETVMEEKVTGETAAGGAASQENESLAKTLFARKTPYTGDAPAVSALVSELADQGVLPEAPSGGIELLTDEEPYGLLLHYGEAPEDEETFTLEMSLASEVLLALVENLDHVEWTYESVRDGETVGIIYYWDTEAAAQILPEGHEIKEYGESEEKLAELLEICREQRDNASAENTDEEQPQRLTKESTEESGQESSDVRTEETETAQTGETEEEAQVIGGVDGPTSIWVVGTPDLG